MGKKRDKEMEMDLREQNEIDCEWAAKMLQKAAMKLWAVEHNMRDRGDEFGDRIGAGLCKRICWLNKTIKRIKKEYGNAD